MVDGIDLFSKGSKLFVEISRSKDEDNDDDAYYHAGTTNALNDLYQKIIHNSLADDDEQSEIPVFITVKALHLMHNLDGDGNYGEKNSEESMSVGYVCPLVGIPLPNSLSEQNECSDRQFLLDILPVIHPSLIQLQPCSILRGMTISTNQSLNDLLLLRIHINDSKSEKSSEEEINEELVALYSIIDEINGEGMVGAPSNIIQAFIISQLSFISEGQQFRSDIKSCSTQASLEDSKLGDMEHPTCPVCRYRIEPDRLGLPQLKSHQQCSLKHDRRCNNMQFLAPWEFATCEACQLLQKRLELSGAQPFHQPSQCFSHLSNRNFEDALKCYRCRMEETLWVCLTCGVVGCGRYSSGHAKQHFIEKRHPFSLELATQRIWDYETSSFVQRDDLLNCPFMQQILGAVNRAAYHGAALNNEIGRGGIEFGSSVKKTHMIGEQYEVLLQSALEDQAQHYEGQISRLQAELAGETINKGQLSDSERKEIEQLESAIRETRVDVDHLSRGLVKIQAEEASHRAKANALLRQQGAIQKLLETSRMDLASEEKAGQLLIEELEQQILDITSNIRMREQIARNNDLNQAQIYGTSGEPKQQRTGKKKGSRRGRRK